MEDKKNKIDIRKRELSKEDIERLEILHKSEEIKGEQLTIDINSDLVIENQAKILLGKKIDDPVEKFQLYYNGLLNY